MINIKKTKEFNEKLIKFPNDVNLWIDFLKF